MPDFTPSNPGAMFPAYKLSSVTPSDTTVLTGCRGLWVGGAGTVNIIACNDTAPVSLTVPAGTLLPIFVSKVMADGTSATLIVALY
jgi:hypothetical protein